MMKSKRVETDETAELVGKILVEGHAESPQRGKELIQKLLKGIGNDPTALHELASQLADALTESQKAAYVVQLADALTESQKAAYVVQLADALSKEQLEKFIAQLQAKLHGKREDKAHR